MSRPLPPGTRVRTAPSRDDVVAMRKVWLSRNAGQVRTMRLTSNLLIALTVFFAWLSIRAAHHVVPWTITAVCAVFCVLSRLLVRRVNRGVERHFSRPVLTIFADDALYIDDDDDLWTIPYESVRRLDRSRKVNEVLDTEGGVTLLPLSAIPDAEASRFPR